jgi:hypothetical protein
MDAVTTLILPGLGNSGPEHWQSLWVRDDASCRRVDQAEWDAPRCADWAQLLDEAIAGESQPVVLVGHSSSCAMVAQWARGASAARLARVKGALLVAPSDPEGPAYPAGPSGFGPVPLARLPFPSIVVASTDDVYVSLERAKQYADAWGSTFVDLGPTGHINAASGLGTWGFGYAMLNLLREHADAITE